MSTTKIIKGWVRDKEDDRQTIFQVDTARQGHFEVPCTLYIGPGKLWTDEEVRAELARKDAEIEALRNPWISVKDRLPIKERWVIVVADGAMNCAWYDKKRGWHNGFNERPKNIRIEEITHWVPLPTPPKP